MFIACTAVVSVSTLLQKKKTFFFLQFPNGQRVYVGKIA